MQKITVDKDELYELIKKAVREVFHEEAYRFWLDTVAEVSEEEMDDIERRYGRPSSERDVAYSESVQI